MASVPPARPAAPAFRGGAAAWPLGYHVLVVGALAFLTIPRMAQVGMFVDGVTYAAIARNLAHGIGTVWQPSYTETVHQAFHEQPPLGLALQAAWFRVVGDAWWVERAYSLVMVAITAGLLAATWRETIGARGFAWLPLMFWLLPGAVSWAAVNNMLENTQVVFTTLAVYAFLRGAASGRTGWGLVAGCAVTVAALVKGPVGTFPLAAPAVLWLVVRPPRRAALLSGGLMWAASAGSAGLALALGAGPALDAYARESLFPTVAGPRQSGIRGSQFVRHLVTGTLLRMSALFALLALVGRVTTPGGERTAGDDRGRESPEASRPAWTWFFFVLAFAGSVPVILSGRIAGHYFVPASPMFALAFAGLTLPFVARAQDATRAATVGRALAGIAGGAMLVAAVLVPVLLGPMERRDAAWVSAFQALAADVPRGVVVGTCAAARENWGLHAYLQRLYGVSLDAEQPGRHDYFLQVAGVCDVPAGCAPVATTTPFTLARCGSAPPR